MVDRLLLHFTERCAIFSILLLEPISATVYEECGMNITVVREGREYMFQGDESSSLLEQLRSQKLYVSAACGGRGTCGKCKVRMMSGAQEPSKEDIGFFAEEELAEGWRLACRTFPKDD